MRLRRRRARAHLAGAAALVGLAAALTAGSVPSHRASGLGSPLWSALPATLPAPGRG